MKWLDFRKEVIELDGGACVRCGRNESGGIILHVHHKIYLKDCLPWEYPYEHCEALCRGCHASEHGIIPPKVGWDFIDEEDLGDLIGTCEYCGTDIRYVFYIQHPHWEPMGVGEICCDNLTGVEIASNLMESKRRYENRVKRFIRSSRWQSDGNIFAINQKRFNIKILPSPGGFRIEMNTYIGKSIYPTVDIAKGKVFEVIESGSAEKFFKKKSKK